MVHFSQQWWSTWSMELPWLEVILINSEILWMGKKCILITTANLNIRALFIAGDIEEEKFFTLCPR